MHPNEPALESLAANQCGRFTRAQAREFLGDEAYLIESRVRSGRWRRLTSRVVRLPGAPGGWLGDLWTAVLHVGPDAVASHGSAARVHDLSVPQHLQDALSVPAGAHRRFDGVKLFQSRRLPDSHRTEVGRLPVTTLARTLFDVSEVVSPARISRWMDGLTAHRRIRSEAVADLVQGMRVHGRRRAWNLERVLSERLPRAGVEQGPLESALTAVLDLAGVSSGLFQYPHPGRYDGGEFADRAWPELRLLIEADGRCWHDRIEQAMKDSRRDSTALAAGWVTARYRHEQLVRHPDVAAADLRSTFEARARDLRVPVPRTAALL